MTIFDIYYKIREGKSVEGWTLQGDLLFNDKQCFRITINSRLCIREVPHPNTLVENRELGETTVKTPRFFKKYCERCGVEFVCSKFNHYKSTCSDCSRQVRVEKGEDRAKVCMECGSTFYISKYRPYTNPQYCPRCVHVRYNREKRRLLGHS